MSIVIRLISYTKTYYCRCGQKLTIVGSDHRRMLATWADAHKGAGHSPCTASEYKKIKNAR